MDVDDKIVFVREFICDRLFKSCIESMRMTHVLGKGTDCKTCANMNSTISIFLDEFDPAPVQSDTVNRPQGLHLLARDSLKLCLETPKKVSPLGFILFSL